jgi:hypothetical protein
VRGKVPHPKGEIAVSVDGREARITLPAGVKGEFVWGGKVRELQEGENRFALTGGSSGLPAGAGREIM